MKTPGLPAISPAQPTGFRAAVLTILVLTACDSLIPSPKQVAWAQQTENAFQNGEFEEELNIGWTQMSTGTYTPHVAVHCVDGDPDPDYEVCIWRDWSNGRHELYQTVTIPDAYRVLSFSAKLWSSPPGFLKDADASVKVDYRDGEGNLLGSTVFYHHYLGAEESISDGVHVIPVLHTDWAAYSYLVSNELDRLEIEHDQIRQLKLRGIARTYSLFGGQSEVILDDVHLERPDTTRIAAGPLDAASAVSDGQPPDPTLPSAGSENYVWYRNSKTGEVFGEELHAGEECPSLDPGYQWVSMRTKMWGPDTVPDTPFHELTTTSQGSFQVTTEYPEVTRRRVAITLEIGGRTSGYGEALVHYSEQLASLGTILLSGAIGGASAILLDAAEDLGLDLLKEWADVDLVTSQYAANMKGRVTVRGGTPVLETTVGWDDLVTNISGWPGQDPVGEIREIIPPPLGTVFPVVLRAASFSLRASDTCSI